MKKILSLILAILVLSVFVALVGLCADINKDFVKETEFTVASYNSPLTYSANQKDLTAFEDACWWLLNNKSSINLKYFSLLGQITSGSRNTYANTVTAKGMTVAEFQQLFLEENDWKGEFSALATATEPFKDEDIPMGVSLLRRDYYSAGFNRDSYLGEYFPVASLMPDEAEFDYLDDYNYYSVVEHNGQEYVVYHLELFPRLASIAWFNSTLATHPDKYAIVFTGSMIDDNGDMYTIWDRELGATPAGYAAKSTSICDGINIYSFDKPTDGELTWQKAFDKHDNILAIISSNVTVDDIVVSKATNSRGYDTALIAANVSNGYDKENGPTFLLTKFSEDNKEITCTFTTAFKGNDRASEKTVKLDNIATLASPDISESLPQIPFQYNGANIAYIFGYEGNTFRPNANMTRAEACTIFARLILGIQTIPDGYTTRFTDVKSSDWFYNAVAFLDQTGYFYRNTASTYKPNEPITRAEFVDLANSASALVAKNEGVEFKDVPADHFYYDSVIAAAASGLVNGYEDNTFRPDNTITRAEVVTVINRLLGLKTSDKTVSLTHLENEFVDIKTHWARLNILMASNSNVHGDYYYEASFDGVVENATSYTLENKHFQITIEKNSGRLTKFINLYTGEDIKANASNPQFIYLTNDAGNKVSPTRLETDGNRIKVTFKGGAVVYLIVDVEDDYMTFEIDSEVPSAYKKVTFANISINNTVSDNPNAFRLSFMGMTAWVNPVEKGYNASGKVCYAHAETQYASGTMGAKIGVVFSKQVDNVKFLQKVSDAIDRSVGLATKTGGPYAMEAEGNFGDYVIITALNPDTLDKTIELMKEMDIDQYDFHQSPNTFRQGDFYFYNTETGTAREFYDKYGKKFDDAGIDTGLHTYAYYINPSATSLLSDPKWQKDLETLDDVYTLRGNLSKFKAQIKTEEDATGFDLTVASFYKNTRYILIDNEIIYVGKGTTEGFINCHRAQCGTVATAHEAGAKIYHLSGYFTLFCPKMGSNLFYHVADLTAKAYNDGGFSMLYLDAIDGINKHLKAGEEKWYYYQMFVQRILSQCKDDPIVEMSDGAPQEWNVRGRRGAWDTTAHGIKKSIDAHVNNNKLSILNNQTTTLGWFSFFPDQNPTSGMKNTIEKTIFFDDIDYLGTQALIYDMSMVYTPFSVKDVKDNPFYYRNVIYYVNLYTKLRKSHYFKDETLKKVKDIGGEWKVIEKDDGEYAFLQMYYSQANLGNYTDNYTFKANNPFASQKPFIRIESRYSATLENPVTLTKFDENKMLEEQIITKFCALDMRENMVMRVKIKGTGVDGDALLISLQTNLVSSSSGRTDHFIDLDYDGWREFILLDADNAEYDTDKYEFDGIDINGAGYSTYRFIPGYSNINKVVVRANTISATKAQIGEFTTYKQDEAPVTNPTVKVGLQTLTFNTTVKGGEYIELDQNTGKAFLYHNAEQTIEEITYTGSITAPSGKFDVVYSANAQTTAPVRARITLGFAGQEITN